MFFEQHSHWLIQRYILVPDSAHHNTNKREFNRQQHTHQFPSWPLSFDHVTQNTTTNTLSRKIIFHATIYKLKHNLTI